MKRTRLKPMSKKRKAAIDEWGPIRKQYVKERRCVIDEATGDPLGFVHAPATDCHEIHGGRHRQTTFKDKRYWLAVHRSNHDALQNMPKARQWAIKLLYDVRNFDINALSELAGVRVDPADVLAELANILKGNSL